MDSPMNRKAFEVGIQRTYYVLWALFGMGFSAALISQEYDRSGDILVVLGTILVGILGVAVLVPWIVMRAIRWIYRGFLLSDTKSE